MKTICPKCVYVINNKTYELDRVRKELKVKDVIYDSRKEDFILLETEKDVDDMSFVAPELYGVLEIYE